MAEYQLATADENGPVIRTADGAWIPDDPGNADWQKYCVWCEGGGVPDPYVPPPEPEPVPDPLVEAQRANSRLDDGVRAAQQTAQAAKQKPAPKEALPPPVTQDQLAALQAQVDMIQQSMTAMLQAHAGPVQISPA